jgi:tRNA dimethylallyltransferase
MDTPKPDIVVICGPTGIGKTSTAISLAEMYNGEIVGADSMQIYQLMEIGTAKPTPEEQVRVPHHMVDIIRPDTPFDAARYEKMARDVISSLHARGKLPIVAGGTGFYIKALTQGLFDTIPTDPMVRERLQNETLSLGNDVLHKRLENLDPETAKRLHPNDTYRIVRALEVFEVTGKPLSAHHQGHQFAGQYFRQLKIALTIPRELLYERINFRVDLMLNAGLLNEVRMLLEKGYAPELKSMQSIGYRHMVDFIQGRLSWEEAVRTMKRDTRHYAKRQMVWFKKDPEVHWMGPDQLPEMQGLVEDFLKASVGRQ